MIDLSSRTLLNKTFVADGIFSLVAGSVLIVGAERLAALVSRESSSASLIALGVGLLLWGVFHIVSLRKGGPSVLATRISIGGDILWQIGSLVLLAAVYRSLTAIGIVLIVVAMIGVADFLFFKMKGASLARMSPVV
ncbi:hypothetical protein PYH37_002485 [Sinorhizobium numidicum]|uniref:Transmembrane protein n=1 Tax=Sinorhizobium numidicum TaxID=680248 RepID=A0ABY8D0C5_9HYPH|nr:hypothetical protein [Sinorhizobium numidicum]WEX77671.1 hypothetical protein PYH37_002485 [Sinorhizobium numidicum]WEX84331.1 hypothetical protein PYH38_003198 [Sinorhizobium numidicum]